MSDPLNRAAPMRHHKRVWLRPRAWPTLSLVAAVALTASLGCLTPASDSRAQSASQGAGATLQATEPLAIPAQAAVENEADLPFHIIDFEWFDAQRQRPVPVRLYWPKPDAHPQAKSVPLVAFSHGLGGSRMGYSHLGRYWASQGYASLHIQHIGSDRQLWTGNVFSTLSKLQNAADASEAMQRVADVRFAVDQLLAINQGQAVASESISRSAAVAPVNASTPASGNAADSQAQRGPRWVPATLTAAPDIAQLLHSRPLNHQRFVLAGHSYGANTAMLLAGARVERDGKVMDFRDPRFQAAILLSAPPFYGEDDFSAILRSVQIPTLHVTTVDDVIRVPGYHSTPDDRIKVFEATGSPVKVLAVFDNGTHSVFTDRRMTGSNAMAVKQATQQLSTAFLRKVFDGDDRPLTGWPGQFKALLARFVGHS